MGVAVGTVYLYVESKEALFDLVIRYAAREDDAWLDELAIPVKTPPPGTTLEVLRSAFSQCAEWPVLLAALAADDVPDAPAELRDILAEQYHLTFRYRRALLLLTRCALEFPGLTEVFVIGLRDRLLDLLAAYLSKRARTGRLRTVPDAHAAAALMIQSIAWSTLQRPHDPGMIGLSDEVAEAAALDLLVYGMRPLL